ncbi:hypothetical protein CFOL_v3_16513 [Cephalotus follicularis]|uniref:Uncharacterized protein n=1 Tax=Cephalotus follicularis TaxID=3775 RepID=A0A1Q3BYD9_CEPFO|nr:hypothetical protein CFOL_v3_16513 [Cephalotus follicularis]
MDHRKPEHGLVSGSQKLLHDFIISVAELMSVCAKQASRVSKKLKTKPTNYDKHNNKNRIRSNRSISTFITSKISPLTPSRAGLPKQLMKSVSNKAIAYLHGKRVDGVNKLEVNDQDEFGDGGVWRRAIMMGDKCQPLDFSGVIYYDSNGKQLSEVPPRLPRASPLPGYLARK